MPGEKQETDKKLSESIFRNRETGVSHLPYERELAFYDAVKSGDEEAVRALMLPLKDSNLGVLSDNPVRNLKYHLIITIAMITRFCIESGMPAESAYTLSDIYIKQADRLQSEDEISDLHKTLVFDYTKRMKTLYRENAYSKPVTMAVNYIEKHLHDRISSADLAGHLGVSKSYLCRLFKKETHRTISACIKQAKVKAAVNMLLYSEMSPLDIALALSFSSQSYFIKVFKEETGYTPADYRKRFFSRHFDCR